MNIAKYWKEKTKLVENAFEGWQRKDEILVRKLIVSKVMNIPIENVAFYCKKYDWYLKFVLGDGAEVDNTFVEEETIKAKVQNILTEYFYIRDYNVLCKMKEDFVFEETDAKKKVCECIKILVEAEVYKMLDATDKATLDVLEKIYFCPIDLFNEYVEEIVGTKNYYSMLLEQWKTANEMAANISAQRNNMNNFYMSMMSIFIGGVFLSDSIMKASLLTRTVFYLAIMVMGIICCKKWIAQIDNFGRLNGEKYEVIETIERKLPVNVLLYEYLQTEQNARKTKQKINFSVQEKGIAKVFCWTMIVVPVLMLVLLWSEYLWKSI